MYERTSGASTTVQTVDELSGTIRTVITGSPFLRGLAVRGEVQNFKLHGSGHVYFTLAGSESRIAAVMFRSHTSGIVSWPVDGDEVVVTGNIDVYPKGGTYQLYAARIMPIGLGAAQRAREELRARLEREGLFDVRHKRPIPKYPSKVAVVTSPTGAALRDIIEVSLKRAPFIDIVVIPATVQGVDAPLQVSRALATAGRLAGVDCVIVARGGGTKDDLSPFDDELMVRAVRSCPVPVVTGVGHQIDNSLADLAADMALPTPSAAAEKVFPDRQEMALLLTSRESLARSLTGRALERTGELLAKIDERIFKYTLSSAERYEAFLARASAALHALSPLAVLGRGFSICRNPEGRAIRNSAEVKPGDHISIQFHSGNAEADITVSN
ncbi:MAG: exodeoxyribonuclease VII large subunit [Synergistaceae bacterium]|nr:exodeoxyribonuclease VII large subunit [Synergistaceae bacterium]